MFRSRALPQVTSYLTYVSEVSNDVHNLYNIGYEDDI
jgi:hypothetical protein